jgi:chemotaxis protein histidine kinase CheA
MQSDKRNGAESGNDFCITENMPSGSKLCTMSDWQTQFAAIRQQFFARAQPRLVKTIETLDALAKNSGDAESLAAIRKDMHWLAGVGGTYKLPEITEIGESGEQLCDKFIESSQALPQEELARLRSLAQRAQAIIGGECGS